MVTCVGHKHGVEGGQAEQAEQSMRIRGRSMNEPAKLFR